MSAATAGSEDMFCVAICVALFEANAMYWAGLVTDCIGKPVAPLLFADGVKKRCARVQPAPPWPLWHPPSPPVMVKPRPTDAASRNRRARGGRRLATKASMSSKSVEQLFACVSCVSLVTGVPSAVVASVDRDSLVSVPHIAPGETV